MGVPAQVPKISQVRIEEVLDKSDCRKKDSDNVKHPNPEGDKTGRRHDHINFRIEKPAQEIQARKTNGQEAKMRDIQYKRGNPDKYEGHDGIEQLKRGGIDFAKMVFGYQENDERDVMRIDRNSRPHHKTKKCPADKAKKKCND